MAYQAIVKDAGVIEPKPLNPTEKFVTSDNNAGSNKTMLGDWQWEFSDLVGNTERGVLAEVYCSFYGCRL